MLFRSCLDDLKYCISTYIYSRSSSSLLSPNPNSLPNTPDCNKTNTYFLKYLEISFVWHQKKSVNIIWLTLEKVIAFIRWMENDITCFKSEYYLNRFHNSPIQHFVLVLLRSQKPKISQIQWNLDLKFSPQLNSNPNWTRSRELGKESH
jgi:hypothetical protein